MKNKEITATLNNWVWDPRLQVYWGFIKNDTRKRWRDGTWIHTSRVTFGRDGNENDIIETLNSVYKLGKKQKEIL